MATRHNSLEDALAEDEFILERKAEGERRLDELLATPDGSAIRIYPPLSEFQPTREFRTRPGKLKPGSLDESGRLINRDGRAQIVGPVLIPEEYVSDARLHRLDESGWWVADAIPDPDKSGRSLLVFVIRLSGRSK